MSASGGPPAQVRFSQFYDWALAWHALREGGCNPSENQASAGGHARASPLAGQARQAKNEAETAGGVEWATAAAVAPAHKQAVAWQR
eukprot:COSAG01_NODE_42868_length_435_cov_6.056548_1_plen_86_part_01